ncbi:hypothetical protein DPX16_8946 [Anabarilius grahami]|uniref:Uncharacterized protein n=1 Tax=Anabarilius grahami TaxID=495550 RepID=A0A3N0ZA55_ANAGA|nr:hypothetical protein DPX16_8946 [Anabarilius grahami]
MTCYLAVECRASVWCVRATLDTDAADMSQPRSLLWSPLVCRRRLDRLAALESKNCVEDTNSKKRRRVHSPKIALPVRHITRQYAGASGNLQTSRSCIAGGSCEAFSSESSEKKEAARSKTEFEDEVGLWKCANIDLMSDEEDGIIDGVSGWIVRPPSFRSQELTERHAAVEIRGDSKVQGNAPQTSAKWTEFRQNAASYLQLRSGKQTFHGAVGFWASLPCDSRLKQVVSRTNETAVAVTDYLNLAGLVSCVSNPMMLLVTILSDQSVICSVYTSHLVSCLCNFPRPVCRHPISMVIWVLSFPLRQHHDTTSMFPQKGTSQGYVYNPVSRYFQYACMASSDK